MIFFKMAASLYLGLDPIENPILEPKWRALACENLTSATNIIKRYWRYIC